MIGIDLGTSNSYIAFKNLSNDRVEILTDPILGGQSIPNLIAFDSNHIKVSSSCINFKKTRPQILVNNSKQLIGKSYQDVLFDFPHFPFKLTNINGKPTYEILFKNNYLNVYPEHLTGLLLSYLKYVIELNINTNIYGCVLTVPGYFNKSQRDATLFAAKLANLNVTRIVSDCITTSVAFFSEKNLTGNYLIFNYGSTTLDISVLEVESLDKINLITNEFEYNCGGREIDEILLEYCAEEFKRLHDIDHSSLKERAILRDNCENAKKVLSKLNAEQVYDWAYEKAITLKREKFEELCFGIFGRLLEKVELVLERINFNKLDINHVIMIGGSSQIPYLKFKLQEFFGIEPFLFYPETAIARGAAILSEIISKEPNSQDITSESFGISIYNPKNNRIHLNAVITPKGSSIPCIMKMKRKTTFDYQRRANIRISIGESKYFDGNVFLGEFTMHNITRDLAGRVKFEITFTYMKNDSIKITAKELPCELVANQAEIQINLGGTFYTKIEQEKIEAAFKNLLLYFTT